MKKELLIATATIDVCPRCGKPKPLIKLRKGPRVCRTCITIGEVVSLLKK